MWHDYKVIAVTPAGRQKYLEILVPYVLKNHEIIDEYHLWLNTENKTDLHYIGQLANQNDFIKAIPLGLKPEGNRTIHNFFKRCCDKKTIYIRFDDDICFIADNAVEELLRFRIENPNYFLVFPNIINNSIVSHIHQRLNILNTRLGVCKYDVLCSLAWKNPRFAYEVHTEFLDRVSHNNLSEYIFKQWILNSFERFSINCMAWFGSKFAEFHGIVGQDEEVWLTVNKPKEIRKYNAICGSSIVAHFAYYTQRPFLEQTDLLKRYQLLLKLPLIKKQMPLLL